ncbi:hypothetical protein DENSPDRAFT_845069 [Dentipellis sp. KUC8613]|nr:hypothetical protein DENSPDRAFT_845069 [Dentipellis sp. KUC8613]
MCAEAVDRHFARCHKYKEPQEDASPILPPSPTFLFACQYIMSAVSGSLYLAGFAQVGQPHAAIVLASSSDSGHMGHIVAKTGVWAYKFQAQNISNSLSLTSLIKIRDTSSGPLTSNELNGLLVQVTVPPGNEEGECLNWMIRAVELLAEKNIVALVSATSLRDEFSTFCAANRSRASSSKYPNVKVSEFCS